MPTDEGAGLRDALKALEDGRRAGDAYRAETALERALLTTSAAGIDANEATVAKPGYPECVAMIVQIGDHLSKQFDVKA